MALKTLFYHITSFIIWDKANNSISVLDVVTVFYLVKR
jgi:hypothetical protein